VERIAVVSPHLDDAVLSAWLVLRNVKQARVITCFAGSPPIGMVGSWDAKTGLAAGAPAITIRRQEDVSAIALAGGEAIHLDCIDAQYRGESAAPVDELTSLLQEQLSDADEVWLPAGLGDHVDHVATRRATLAATTQAQRRYLYADLPYAGQPAWSAEVTGGARDIAVQAVCRRIGRPTPADRWRSTLAGVAQFSPADPRVQRLTPAQTHDKLRALACYSSQLAALKCGRLHPLRRRRVFAYEISWPLVTDCR
jgi:LmbE family N-acetylglucosaminyl deacetylase